MADDSGAAQLEIRASWTPVLPAERAAGGDLDVAPHVEAWGELLCTAVGLPPVPDGVAVMPEPPRPAGPGVLMAERPDTPDDSRSPSTDGRPSRRSARCSRCATGCPPLIETEAGLAEACAAIAGRHRPGRDRRRAGLGLPLLQPRLPDPAAPRGRRHRARRPDRVRVAGPAARRRSRAPSGSCTPPPRTCPASPTSGLLPASLFDTELAGRLLGYPRVGLATLVETVLGFADEEGALGRRLVDPAAARALAGVRRPRRRGPRRAARRAVRPSSSRPARTSGRARSSTHLRSFEPTPARRRLAAYLRHAPGPRPPRPGRRHGAVGDPRRARRAARRHARAGSSPTPRSWPPRQALPDDKRRAAGDQGLPRPRRRALRQAAGSPRSSAVAGPRRGRRCRPARRAVDGPPLPRAWAERDPVAARRLRSPARR